MRSGLRGCPTSCAKEPRSCELSSHPSGATGLLNSVPVQDCLMWASSVHRRGECAGVGLGSKVRVAVGAARGRAMSVQVQHTAP